ncbi:MAG: hypothetical protein HQM08_16005 [Candidatus Riflebacteria bacterium]|nr:hypothetical protein [Candidatus Riflebacteria bacterium]
MKTFLVSGVGKHLASASAHPENRHLIQTSIRFDWKAKVGKGNVDSMCQLFSPVGPKPASLSLIFEQTAIEKEIAYVFFESPGESLAQLISEYGGNYQTILSLGIIHCATLGFINSSGLTKFLADLKQAETYASLTFSDKTEEYLAKQKLAKAYYDLGNACFIMSDLCQLMSQKSTGSAKKMILEASLPVFRKTLTAG